MEKNSKFDFCIAGNESNSYLLRELTENVLLLKNLVVAAYIEFFKVIFNSIKISSICAENNFIGFGSIKRGDETILKIDFEIKKELFN